MWNTGNTEDPVRKYLHGLDREYDDGQHIIYVNAAVDDGSPKAALMRYFKTCAPDDMSQGALSRRVHYLKREKGGIEEMCEYSERIFNGGREEGRRERQDEILKMIAGVSRQGSAEDVINEIINKIYGEEKAMTDV